MTSRVTNDDTLKDEAGRTIIHRPVIIVEITDDNKHQCRIHMAELDPNTNDPRLFGIVLSDLVDHIAAAYQNLTDRDERDIRAEIMKTILDENRFKDKDPARGKLRGVTVMPRSN